MLKKILKRKDDPASSPTSPLNASASSGRRPMERSASRDASLDLAIAKLLESNVDDEANIEKLRKHARKLTKALRDEREYTQSLKNQVDRLHLVQMQPSNQVQEELIVVKKMFEETDQARFEATSELEQVKQTLANLQTEYEKTKVVGQKAAQTAAEMAALKSECDEFQSKNSAMDAQIAVLSDELIRRNQEFVALKGELESRPTTDDVGLLKKEMHGLQENFLKAALEKETEVKEVLKKKNELSEEWARSQARIKALEAELGAKSMTSSEHVQRLEFQVQDLKEQLALAPKQAEVDRQRDKIEDLKKKIAESEKPEEVARLQERVKFLEVQLNQAPKQTDLDQKLTLIAELQTEKKSRSDKISSFEAQIQVLNRDLREAPKQDYVTALEQRLQEKDIALTMSRKEGTAMESRYLECEKEVKQSLGRLAEKEASLARLAVDLEKSHALAREEATLKGTSQEEAKQRQVLLDEETRKVASRERRIAELEGDFLQVRESVARLESERADLIEKIEAGEGVATAIDQLTREKEALQLRLSQLEESSRAEVASLQMSTEQRERQLQTLSNEVESWKEKFREQSVDLGRVQQDRERLARDFDANVSALSRFERENEQRESDLKAELAVEREAVQAARDLVKQKELDYGTMKEGLSEKLNAAVRERDEIVADLEAKLREKENRLETLESKISQLSDEKDNVVNRLNEADKSLFALRVNFDELNAEHLKTKSEFTEKVEKLDKTHEEACQKTEELKQKSSHLEQSLSVSSKESELLKSKLSESEVMASNLKIRIEEVEKELGKARASASEEKSRCESKLVETEAKVSEARSKVKSLEAALEAEKGSTAELRNTIKERSSTVQETKDELVAVKIRNDELQTQLTTERERAAALQGRLTELDGQLLQHVDQKDSREKLRLNQLAKKDEQISAMQSDLQMLHQEIEEKESVCTNYELQLVRAQAERKEEKSRAASLEKELDETKKDLAEMSKQSDLMRKSAEETESLMNSTVQQLTEVKSALSDRVSDQDAELKTLREKFKEISDEKNDLTALLKAKETAIIAATQKRSEVQRDKEVLVSDLATEREGRSEEQRSFEESRISMETRIQSLESQLTDIEGERRRMEDEVESKEAKLRVQLASVTSEFEETKRAYEILKDSCEDTKVQHEVEMSALSGNLATLRTELEASKRRTAAEKNTSNKLRGDIAVLQASLQNFQDERRKLLERCVGNDEEIQKLRGHAANLKQRLDETHGALQDLGRENATLQVNQTRNLGRRWVDDSEIIECTRCKKKFSFSVRKHHCRNCGLIFCYECSSRSVKLPAYKDPVRVCDDCFKEKTA